MFTNELPYTKTKINDISLHDGVPKQFFDIRNKTFNDWEIPPWELEIYRKNLLGRGSFSEVYLSKWRATYVVSKIIKDEIIEIKKELVLREIETLTKLHHPNIVQVLGYIDEPFIIVTEYIPKGNLLTNLKLLNRSNKIKIMRDILKGLAYFHNRKPEDLIHRDMKLSNILLTNDNSAKIADFGLSKFTNINKSYSNTELNLLENNNLTTFVGTEPYIAPEIPCSNYTNKIDIYSTGILLYELFETKLHNKSKEIKWFWCPKKIKYMIINYMLTTNPELRKTAIELIDYLDLM